MINRKDIEGYIELFSADNREKMNKYIDINGTDEFFHENEVSMIDKGSLLKCSILTEYEFDKYEDYCGIYSYMKTDEGNELKDDFSVFVFVMEDGYWKIYRKIVPDIEALVGCGVKFGTDEETELLISQKEKMSVLSDWSNSSTYSLTEVCPTNIRVCFTKQENISCYGKTGAVIEFQTYLKNVIPCEWYVSYYEKYPSYLQAGAMASKMYAWYCTIRPMFSNSPYSADVDDSSESQNFLYNAYTSLSQEKYRTYVDYSLGFCSHLAMVTEKTERIFCVQYRSASGTIHSGVLNQQGAYEMARNGSSALEILQEYLGSTPETRGEKIKFIGHN